MIRALGKVRLEVDLRNRLRWNLAAYWIDENTAGVYLTFGYDGGDQLLDLTLDPIAIRSDLAARIIDRLAR